MPYKRYRDRIEYYRRYNAEVRGCRPTPNRYNPFVSACMYWESLDEKEKEELRRKQNDGPMAKR